MKNKKSQIKMFETIAVIIVFFFILAFGLVYYNMTQRNEVNRIKTMDIQLQSIELINRINGLPELQCSIDNVISSNCFDLYKIEGLKAIMEIGDNKMYYNSMFKDSTISVLQIYPSAQEWLLYSNTKSNPQGKQHNRIPILIYDPVKRRYNTGILVVEVYN